MRWEVETVEYFDSWFLELKESEQIDVDAHILLLEEYGPNLPRPYADTLNGSKHTNMKELRIQHKGKPYRILYAFDPRRKAILLLGGNKEGDKRWYKKNLPIADESFDEHLKNLKGK